MKTLKVNNQFLNLKEGDLENILSIIEKFPSFEKVLLFGSRAKGNARRTSDVDLAVISDKQNEIQEFKSYLNELTFMPYHFDVINYNMLSNIALKEEIDKFGIDLK